jgi:hypothetical protein
MAVRTPAQLREMAVHFREIASMGDDPRLRAALRLVADEFEKEAEESSDRAAPTVSGLARNRQVKSVRGADCQLIEKRQDGC